jgi:hypothetical protein
MPPTPTVILWTRIPAELRDRLDAAVRARRQTEPRASLQSVVTELLTAALPPARARRKAGGAK